MHANVAWSERDLFHPVIAEFKILRNRFIRNEPANASTKASAPWFKKNGPIRESAFAE